MNQQAVRGAVMAALLALVSIGVVASPSQAVTASSFQLPFPCGQSWRGDSDNSNAHTGPKYEIDFNRGTGSDDLGDTVVAAAAGTVSRSEYSTTSGYGNWVEINHGDGWRTRYAHLKARAVKVGELVLKGQAIGALGNTSAKANISPHLHYEVRLNGAIQKARFNGVTYPYPDATVKSNNCATRYDPAALCGAGFEVIDSARIKTLGTVNLTWKASTKQNCVTTLKMSSTGTRTYVKAYLKPAGGGTAVDDGSFLVYAGPVRAVAPSCITWGGTIVAERYTSPSEHC